MQQGMKSSNIEIMINTSNVVGDNGLRNFINIQFTIVDGLHNNIFGMRYGGYVIKGTRRSTRNKYNFQKKSVIYISD